MIFIDWIRAFVEKLKCNCAIGWDFFFQFSFVCHGMAHKAMMPVHRHLYTVSPSTVNTFIVDESPLASKSLLQWTHISDFIYWKWVRVWVFLLKSIEIYISSKKKTTKAVKLVLEHALSSNLIWCFVFVVQNWIREKETNKFRIQ